MDTSTAIEQPAGLNDGTPQPGAKVYLLPERGFAKYGTGLALQVALCGVLVVALVLVAHYLDPEVDWGRVAWFSGIVVLVLLLYIPIVLRGQKQLWKLVRVEVGDQSVVLCQGAGSLPDLRLLPQAQVRVERDQVTDSQETSYGLVMATRYDPQALIIPNRLDLADYQEIIGMLSQWHTIERRSEGTAAQQASPPHVTGMRSVEDWPVFYERSSGVIPVGLLIGAIAGTLPGLFAIMEWAKDRKVPTDLAWVILAAYIINIFVTIEGTQIAFGWLDYGLAHAGLSITVRSSLWIGIGSATIIFGGTMYTALNPVASLIATLTGSIVIAAGYGFIANARHGGQPAFVSAAYAPEDSVIHPATVGIASGSPVEGAYRLTYGEFLTATGYFTLSQPRSYGRPRFLSAFLPRSVDHGAVQASFAAHPNRNQILRFAADDNSIRFLVKDSSETILGWDLVKQVVRTRKGMLLCEPRHDFEWLPNHAFAAKNGPEVLAALARRHTAYSEVPRNIGLARAGVE